MSITSRAATINVSEIRPSRGNRPLSATHVNHLDTSFGHTTTATALVVKPIVDGGTFKWELVAGFHRFAAILKSGQIEIHVIIVENATDVQLELIRLHENMLHRALTPSQEAKAMARTREIYQMLTPSAKRGGDRRSKTQVGSTSFADKTAAATGRSKTANCGDQVLHCRLHHEGARVKRARRGFCVAEDSIVGSIKGLRTSSDVRERAAPSRRLPCVNYTHIEHIDNR